MDCCAVPVEIISIAKAQRTVDLNGQETWVQDSPDDLSYPASGGGARMMPDAPNLGELSPGGAIPPSPGGEMPRWQPGENLVAWSDRTNGAGRAGANPWSGGTDYSFQGDQSNVTHASYPEGGNDANQGGGRASSPPYSGNLVGPDTGGRWPAGGEGDEQAPVTSIGGTTGVPPSSSAVVKRFDPLELRNEHGEWSSSAGDVAEHGELAGKELWASDNGSRTQSLTDDDIATLHETWYDSAPAYRTNDALRTTDAEFADRVSKPPYSPEYHQRYITTRQSSLKKSSAFNSLIGSSKPFTQLAVAYRYADAAKPFGVSGRHSPGDIITDKGFVSVTADPTLITERREEGHKEATITMKMPAGTKALKAEREFYNNGPDYDTFHEYTLGAGTKFRVISDNGDVANREITVEVVTQ
jgi:hypothetical protein